MTILKRIALAAALAGAVAGSALAQEGAAFFDGKTVDYIVGTDPGGVYDTNGRLVAEFMQKYLPGSTFVVRNMPGAGGIIGANYIYASSPDGLTMGTFNTGIIYAQLVQNEALKFNLTDIGWIGKLASDPRVIVVTTESGIESFEQLAAAGDRVKFATCGIGCASMVESTLLVATFGLPVDVISGYNGNEGQLAMMRGEVHGTVGSRSEFEQFVAEGRGRFIAQIGGSQTDVPQMASFANTDAEARAVALVTAQGQLGRWTTVPPGVPADRMEALQAAFASATSDPEFLEKAKAIGIPVDPLVGNAVRDLVEGALQQPAEVVELLRGAMKKN